MTEKLDTLLKWFPSGTAEGELEILDTVFVSMSELKEAVSPKEGNPILLVGRKGSGKSALVNFSKSIFEKQNVPSIIIRPQDIVTSDMTADDSTGDMVRKFKYALISAVADRVAFAENDWVSDEAATLRADAINAGRATPDFAHKMGRFLLAAARPIIGMDFNEALPHLTSTSRKDVESAVRGIVGRKSFFLFIDDTDQVASPDQKGHLNRIWALLLAARSLCSEMKSLKIVVTLRSEVWERLRLDDGGQRDQVDHFTALIVNMPNSEEMVRKIVLRRLELASTEFGDFANPYNCFFDGQSARAPQSDDYRSWEDLIITRSRNRPRDAIQLINRMARDANGKSVDQISEAVFRAVMPQFSNDVAGNLFQEVKFELPQAREIIRRFAREEFDQGSFTFSSERLKEFFFKVLTSMPVSLFGISLKGNDNESVFSLWRFFYLQDIINARVSDITQKDKYRHLNSLSDPWLVSKARWNDMQKILWEVNTVYRDHIINVQDQERNSVGLAKKEVSRGKKRR